MSVKTAEKTLQIVSKTHVVTCDACDAEAPSPRTAAEAVAAESARLPLGKGWEEIDRGKQLVQHEDGTSSVDERKTLLCPDCAKTPGKSLDLALSRKTA